ncbi:MAG: transcriptional regulator [Actinomycetota bacterium]
MTYAQSVGERLRNIRIQKGFSLHDVEKASVKEFKASVLGAYERGERSISVPRLQRLASFYSIRVDQLLPRVAGEEEKSADESLPSTGQISIDLAKLEALNAPEKSVIQRYLNFVQMQRGDFNGRVLTIRRDDLRAMASVLDLSPETLDAKIDDLRIKVGALN